MKRCFALVLGGLLALPVAVAGADDETTQLIDRAIEAYDREAVVVQAEFDDARAAQLMSTGENLKQLQDKFAAAAQLDEAVAIRNLIRSLEYLENEDEANAELPADAKKILKQHQEALAAIDKKRVEKLKAIGARVAEPLQKVVDQLCRESKFDEALVVRDLVRRMNGAMIDVEEDPGSVSASPESVGQIHYYQVIGNDHNAIWGTDVYTCDSYVATAAVHSGALKVGEQGVVRVTILPGLEKYRATIRNGIESMPFDAYPVSFRVERAYGIFRTSPRREPDPEINPFAPAPNPFGAPR